MCIYLRLLTLVLDCVKAGPGFLVESNVLKLILKVILDLVTNLELISELIRHVGWCLDLCKCRTPGTRCFGAFPNGLCTGRGRSDADPSRGKIKLQSGRNRLKLAAHIPDRSDRIFFFF